MRERERRATAVAQRRLKSFEVARVLRKGVFKRTPHLILRTLSRSAPGSALAVVVPKRLVAGAVERNRFRRQLKAAFSKITLPRGDSVVTLKAIPEKAYQTFVKEAQQWHASYWNSSGFIRKPFRPITGGAKNATS